jgi:peroxiredoxin Q/BCP
MLEEGQPFPAFSLPDQDGRVWTNEDLKGHEAVIFFYPKDMTTGCTIEACEFTERVPDFGDIPVLGVSPDSPKRHQKFIEKESLNLTLLADEEKALLEASGLWIEKSMYGRKYMGVDRTTVLIDADGVIKTIWRKVKPPGHAAEVLASVQ